MAITDRTRKLLWARSGNRCAICKSFLVVEGEAEGETALVGDECHIVAQSPNGPRGGGERPDDIDDCYNLVLLCASDHRLIDEQPDVYTVEHLKAIKKAHEAWLASIRTPQHLPQVRIQPVSDLPATWLTRVWVFRELLDYVHSACEGDYNYERLQSNEEVELVGDFLQELQDLDVYSGSDIRERVRTEFRIDQQLLELERAGFLVYAGRAQKVLEVDGAEQPWPVAIVRVLRASNPAIQEVDSAHNTGAEPDENRASAIPAG